MGLVERFLRMDSVLRPAEEKTEGQLKEDKAYARTQFPFATEKMALPRIRDLIEMSRVLAHHHNANSVLKRLYWEFAEELGREGNYPVPITVEKYWSLVEDRMLKVMIQEEQHKVSNERFVA